jgi:hypothetical protein
MPQVILFKLDDAATPSVMTPTGALSVSATALKDVPAGRPFIIIDSAELPQGIPQEAWTVDFSDPDGYGQGGI